MSRLTQKDNSTFGNVNTHVFTEFSTFNKETTQKEILQAVKDINIGGITIESSDADTHELLTITNTKLDTLNTTVNDKHLNYETDSVTVSAVPALNFTKDSVNVVEEVRSIPYDLQLYSALLYADSVNYNVGIDPNGRPGWFFQNTATTGGSNCYWYSNSTVPQNNMTKAQVECIYTVMSLDRVQPSIVLPIVAVFSKPQGAGDLVPGFARSRWLYTIPTTNILNAGEVIMLTIGDHTKVDNIFPEIRRVHLQLQSTAGPALDSETVAYISLNTDSGVKPLIGSIQYLLQNAGFYYSITEKVVDYQFVNSVDRRIELGLIGEGVYTNIRGFNGTSYEDVGVEAGTAKLLVSDSATTSLDQKINSATEVDTNAIKVYTVNPVAVPATLQAVRPQFPTEPIPVSALQYELEDIVHNALETYDYTLNSKIFSATDVDTEAIKVYTVNGGGGGGGGLVQIQGYNGTDWENVTATMGTLQVSDFKIHNATEVDTEAIKVYTVNSSGGGGDGIIQGTTPANNTVGLNLSCSVYNDGTNNHNVLETQANVYGFNSATGVYQPIGVHATNMLRVQSNVHTASGAEISGTVVNTVRGLNTYNVGYDNLGSFGNILNGGSLTTLTATSGLNINKTYLNDSVIVYEDTNTTLTGGIVVQVSQDDTTYYTLATLFPVTSQAGKRATSSKLLLKPFNYIRILNNSASTYSNVLCSLFSS